MASVERHCLKRIRASKTVAREPLPTNFVRPNYEGFGLANVSPTVLKHFGIDAGAGLDDVVLGDRLKGAKKVVVLLVDALGYLALKDQMQKARLDGFADLAKFGTMGCLTSVFPSTTAVCLSTLHTGLQPVEHGVVGYRMFLSEWGTIANMIRLGPDLDERPSGLIDYPNGPAELLGAPTVHHKLKKAGVASYCLIRKALASSGLSQMLYRGAEIVPFQTVADMMVQVRALLKTDPDKPAVIWAYWGMVDAIQHAYGATTEEMAAEVRNVGFSLKKELLDPLKKEQSNASLMVLADHGHIQVNREDVVRFPQGKGVREAMALPPTGTGRSGYVFARDGQREKLEQVLKRAFKDRALVLDTKNVLEDGLWGHAKPGDAVKRRTGDLVVLPKGRNALFYPYYLGADPKHLLGGRHGGLHEQEMLVPFFCTKL